MKLICAHVENHRVSSEKRRGLQNNQETTSGGEKAGKEINLKDFRRYADIEKERSFIL